MAEVAVTFLLNTLQELLVEESHIISGLEVELQQLQKDFELMRDFLEALANKGEKREAWMQFERNTRDVVFQAEDIIDKCLILAVTEKSSHFWLNNLKPRRLKGAKKKLRDLREKVRRPLFDLARESLAYASGANAQTPKTEHQHQTIPLLREDDVACFEDHVVGFHDELEIIIGNLNEESEELHVIPIIGMGGIGKTTLASRISRDTRVRNVFPTLIWVSVSQEFNTKNIFLNIMKKFTDQDLSRLTDSMLADIVRHSLCKSKFLMIIDGVHTIEDWMAIEVALPKSNKFGKVLVTTRYEKVGCLANPKRDPHRLGFLRFDESWELLQLKIFGKHTKCPPDLEMLGRDIANKCHGVPLSVVVMGGVLQEKLSSSHVIDEWKEISTSVDTYITIDSEKRMENIISLSYNKLPCHLRDCFIYMGVFPEDTEIPAWKIIRLWIAERFIQKNAGKSLEEVAEDNLKDLVNRNLVELDKTKVGGGIKACHISYRIREFCRRRAAPGEQNLFQEVPGKQNLFREVPWKQNLFREVKSLAGVFHPPVSEILNCRRLCIHSDVIDFLRKRPKGPMVRSFLYFSEGSEDMPAELTQSIPDAFNLLRTLDVKPIKFRKFPQKINRLLHLRYIALSGDEFNCLPKAISTLRNLQTIIIDTMLPIFEIKANIWRMMRLRHLKTKAAIVINNKAKGKAGENLQTLSRLSIQCVTKYLCSRILNIKNLGIRGNLRSLSWENCARLERLEKLKLVHDSEDPLISLPHSAAFPPTLMILELSSTFLEWQHMAVLAELPTLEVLKLKDNAFKGKSWNDNGGGFPFLQVLLIASTDLELWTASSDSFPKLRSLVLKNCKKLREIPPTLGKSLEELDIERVSMSVVDSAQKIKKEKKDMQGLPRAGFKLIISKINSG